MEKGNNFERLGEHMKTWLSFSQIFNRKPTKEEIIKDIKSINLNEALTIIAKLSLLDEQSKEEMLISLNPYITDREFIDSVEPFDLINLLYSVKWFIAYGKQTTQYSFENDLSKPFNVFLTVLKITDYLIETIDSEDEVENMVLQSWLFNRPGEIDKALIRQHEMFQKIALNKEAFIKNDYIDIHTIFKMEYGYTIQEYVSILFSMHHPFIKPLKTPDILSTNPWGIPKNFFHKVKISSVAEKITDDLIMDVESMEVWARDTLEQPFNYEVFLTKPLFKSNDMIISFSPGFLNTTIFDGLCFKLNACCRKYKKDFFSFFGRLFEQYVTNTLSYTVNSSNKVPYTFIDEFPFGKDNSLSSDAYLLLGRSLLVFECKGGRLRKETKTEADFEISQKDYTKYAIDPIKQANKAYERIISQEPLKFQNVNKVFVVSVAVQAFPKIPKFNDKQSIDLKELHPHIKFIDYISLSDLELFAYIINKEQFTLFEFIKHKKRNDEYIPYPNYYYKKFGLIKRSEYQDDALKECNKLIYETLF